MKTIFTLILMVCFAISYGQIKGNQNNKNNTKNKLEKMMDFTTINNPLVRKAIEALQNNDKKTWFSYFEDNTVFTDDGNKMKFKSFFDNAFDKKEKFLRIDKIENDGKTIIGNFYAGQWGTFTVFFTFHIGDNGKFNRLDIGQIK